MPSGRRLSGLFTPSGTSGTAKDNSTPTRKRNSGYFTRDNVTETPAQGIRSLESSSLDPQALIGTVAANDGEEGGEAIEMSDLGHVRGEDADSHWRSLFPDYFEEDVECGLPDLRGLGWRQSLRVEYGFAGPVVVKTEEYKRLSL